MKRRFVAEDRKHIQRGRSECRVTLSSTPPITLPVQGTNDWSGFRFRHFIVRGKTEHIDCKRR
jgi:hypothetical protein